MTPLEALVRDARSRGGAVPHARARRRRARRRRGRSRARDADLQRVPLLRRLLRGLPGDDAPARVPQGRRPLPRQPVPQLRRMPARLPVRAAARVRRQRAQGDGAGARDDLRRLRVAGGLRPALRAQRADDGARDSAWGLRSSSLLAVARNGYLWHAPMAGDFYAVFPHNLLVALFAPVFLFACAALAHRRGALLAGRVARRRIGAGGARSRPQRAAR